MVWVKQNWLKVLILVATLISLPQPSFAHPGRTDSSGCHTCRTNCPDWGLSYNEYHCHRAKETPQPIEPIRSIRGDGGTGITVPAPEYKTPVEPFVSTQETAPNPSIEKTVDNQQSKRRNIFIRFFSWLF